MAYIKTLMKVRSKGQSNDQNLLIPDYFSCQPMYRSLSRNDRIEMISRNMLKNTSPESLVQNLKQQQELNSSQEFELQSKLKAALNLYPDFFGKISGILDTTHVQDKRYQLVFNALLVSENQAAQQYLAQFIRK